jgi:hypothetical protein
MDRALFERVWSFLRFNELSVQAAKKAIQDDRLFTEDLPWGKAMDPVSDSNLYHPDGRRTWLSVSEREEQFPRE